MSITVNWSKRLLWLELSSTFALLVGICWEMLYAKQYIIALIFSCVLFIPLIDVIWCLRHPIINVKNDTIVINSRRGLKNLAFPINLLRAVTNDGKLTSFLLNNGLKLDVPSIYIDHKGYQNMLNELAVAGVDVAQQKDA